jgi:hypothetical protein
MSQIILDGRANSGGGNDEYTVLLVRSFNQGNGTTTFVDDSKYHRTITRLSTGVSHRTTQKPSVQIPGNTSSIYANGASDSYLRYDNTADIRPGTKDFCLDFWYYFDTTAPADKCIYGPGYYTNYSFYYTSNAFQMYYHYNVDTSPVVSATTTEVDVWKHCAYCRHNGVLSVYIDGVLGDSAAFTADLSSDFPYTQAIFTDMEDTSFSNWTGYTQNLRFSIGTPRWTGNFSVANLNRLYR